MPSTKVACSCCQFSGPIWLEVAAANEVVVRFRVWNKNSSTSMRPHKGLEVDTAMGNRYFMEKTDQGIVVSRPRRVDSFDSVEWQKAKNRVTVSEAVESIVETVEAANDTCVEGADRLWDLFKFP